MPTLYGRSITLQLSVANLARAVTDHPIPKQCPESSASIGAVERELLNASQNGTLAEEPLAGEDGSHVQFLGKHQDIPFIMVHAGNNIFDPSIGSKAFKRPAKSIKLQATDKPSVYDAGTVESSEGKYQVSPHPPNSADSERVLPNIPHALCLTVFLSRASFDNINYENGVKRTVRHDVKVDVYFNGQFIDSRVITNKQFRASGSRGMQARILRFTGQKIQRMIEKPWILVPPSGSLNDDVEGGDYNNQHTQEAANRRWSALSSSLLNEADRLGRDRNGDRPVTGEFLESLASLPIPPTINEARQAGDAFFGVIDAVVSWGTGQKDGPESKYLTKPTRSRNSKYARRPSGETANNHSQDGNHVETIVSLDRVVSSTPAPQRNALSSSATPAPIANDNPRAQTETLAATSTLDGGGDESSKLAERARIMKGLWPGFGKEPIPPKRSREPSVSSTSIKPPKRQRTAYHDVITTKQTLEEEFESIGERAFEIAKSRRQRMVSVSVPTVETVTSSPLSSAPSEEVSLVELIRPRKIVTLNISPEKLRSSPLKSKRSASRVPQDIESNRPISVNPAAVTTVTSRQSTAGRRSSTATSQREDRTPAADTPAEGPSAFSHRLPHTAQPPTNAGDPPAVSRQRSQTATSGLRTIAFDANFEVPELSKNCCVTYAEAGVVRNTGALRGGYFTEKGVVMGTRFIVG